MLRYDLVLLGRGISASSSPAMHNAALRAVGLEGSYQLCECDPEDLPTVLAWVRRNTAGANVTIPHKQAVARLCDQLVGDAVATGAVNTVVVDNGRLIGHNTDAVGLELALRHAGLWDHLAPRAVVLGAGGAAAAVLLCLARAGVTDAAVVARRPSLAQELLTGVAGAPQGQGVPWDRAEVLPRLAEATVLVNATPMSLATLPFDMETLPTRCAVVDLRYRPAPIEVVAAALAGGHRATDGREMLLRQAMESFRLWTGLEPPTDAARSALEEAVRP